MEAVKQGSAAVGLRSKTHVVLTTVNKAGSDLSSHQRKVFKIVDHVGSPSPASLPAPECFLLPPFPVHQLLLCVCTQRSWKRPYGVGLLGGGLDETGAHLYYNYPSGNCFEYQAFAIGSRSQAAKAYLERRFGSFEDSSREQLIKDAVLASKEDPSRRKLN